MTAQNNTTEQLTELMTYVGDNSEAIGSEIYRQIVDKLLKLKQEDDSQKLYTIKYYINKVDGKRCDECDCDAVNLDVACEEHQHIVRIVPFSNKDEYSLYCGIHHKSQIPLMSNGDLPDFKKNYKQIIHYEQNSITIMTILSFEEY